MIFWWMRRSSSIDLILGDITAGTQAHRERAQKAVREHSTLSSEDPELMPWSPTWDRGHAESKPTHLSRCVFRRLRTAVSGK
jgi:hypothetical protein